MVRTRALRDEPPPGPDQLVFRGILGDAGLDPADLRQAAAGLTEYGLQLQATGQRPHYDVVYEGNDLESLVARLAAASHRIVDNPSVDREEN